MAEKVKACIQVILMLLLTWQDFLYDDVIQTFQNLYYNALYFTQQASKHLDESSRYEILDVLTHLEGELQAKDVTIAALKVD